jgi:hypothetical protein
MGFLKQTLCQNKTVGATRVFTTGVTDYAEICVKIHQPLTAECGRMVRLLDNPFRRGWIWFRMKHLAISKRNNPVNGR